MIVMLGNFVDGALSSIKKIKTLADTPKPPKMYWHNFVAVKYIDHSKRTHRRVMYGSLAKGLNIDLTAFSMEELEELIVCEVFRLIEEGHDLKIHRGGSHIRVWKESSNSGLENYLFIGDTFIENAQTTTNHSMK